MEKTLIPYKGRFINEDKPIRIYRNLHYKKVKTYSVQQFGKIVAHTTNIMLLDCKFVVNEKARQRIIKNKVKEVCAYIEGTLAYDGNWVKCYHPFLLVSFNPYNDKFFMEQNGEPLFEACYVNIGKTIKAEPFIF